MKLFVITNVLCAYTEGLIVVLAQSEAEALELAREQHPDMSDGAFDGGMPDVQEVSIERAHVVTFIIGSD